MRVRDSMSDGGPSEKMTSMGDRAAVPPLQKEDRGKQASVAKPEDVRSRDAAASGHGLRRKRREDFFDDFLSCGPIFGGRVHEVAIIWYKYVHFRVLIRTTCKE